MTKMTCIMICKSIYSLLRLFQINRCCFLYIDTLYHPLSVFIIIYDGHGIFSHLQWQIWIISPSGNFLLIATPKICLRIWCHMTFICEMVFHWFELLLLPSLISHDVGVLDLLPPSPVYCIDEYICIQIKHSNH